jgi:outer membrane lipoprotein-sorting protein
MAASSAAAASATAARAGEPTSAVLAQAAEQHRRELSGPEAEELLKQLHLAMGSIRSAQVEFKQETHRAILEEAILTKGRCVFLFPNKIRFEICEPFRSVLMANGKGVARYEEVGGKWQKLDTVGGGVILLVMNQIASWLQGDFSGQGGIYELHLFEGAGPVVQLLPRPEKMKEFIASIELQVSVDKTRFTSLTIRETGGDYSVMTFTGEQRGLPLAAEAFDVSAGKPPEITTSAAPGSNEAAQPQ